MTMLKYKNFQGAVAFEDGRLLIQLLHIDDFVTSECDKASDVEKTFRVLVDDYLETCALVGKKPSKPFKGSFNVRISPDLHKEAAMAASHRGRSLNAWVEEAIQERLEREVEPSSVAAETWA
jgi:predicted HicB family RNase H-like nuclease